MIGIIAVGTAVRDVFAKRTAQARAPPTVEIVLLRFISRAPFAQNPAASSLMATHFQSASQGEQALNG